MPPQGYRAVPIIPAFPLKGKEPIAFHLPFAKVLDMTREHLHPETHSAGGGQTQSLISCDPVIREAVQA